MIDREQRSIARNIAVGRCPVTHEDASTKARAYGLFAKSVLARISLNVAGEDMKAFQDNSVSGLVKAFADSVYAQGVAVINSMPHHDEEMLRRMLLDLELEVLEVQKGRFITVAFRRN